MFKISFLSCVALFACSVSAAPMKLSSLAVGPISYSNVTVIGANATDLYFTHDRGIGNVKLKYLNADLQKQFNYDPKLAAEAERKQAEADALYASSVASNVTVQAEKAARASSALAKGTEPDLADPLTDKSILGKAAPAMEVEKWLSEKPDCDGKCVLVVFWAPWSAACRQCIPDLNALQGRFAGKLAVIGITSSPETEVAEMSDPKLTFASALDTKLKISNAAGVTSIPCALLIDPKGIIRYQGHPGVITDKKLEGLLAKMGEGL